VIKKEKSGAKNDRNCQNGSKTAKKDPNRQKDPPCFQAKLPDRKKMNPDI
jgi:hypothetical protein